MPNMGYRPSGSRFQGVAWCYGIHAPSTVRPSHFVIVRRPTQGLSFTSVMCHVLRPPRSNWRESAKALMISAPPVTSRPPSAFFQMCLAPTVDSLTRCLLCQTLSSRISGDASRDFNPSLLFGRSKPPFAHFGRDPFASGELFP